MTNLRPGIFFNSANCAETCNINVIGGEEHESGVKFFDRKSEKLTTHSENCHFLELTRSRSNLVHIGNLGLGTRIRDPTTLFLIGSRWKSCPTGKIPIFPKFSKNELLRMAIFARGVHFRGLPVKIRQNELQIRVLRPKNSPWTEFHWNSRIF